MATLTIQPGGKDTFIDQVSPTRNYSSWPVLIVYAMEDFVCRTIKEFPITWGTDIPAGATITSATLSLYASHIYESEGRTYWAYRLLRLDWVEAEATWNVYKDGSDWTTAGCGDDGTDYTSTDEASAIVPEVNDWMSWNVLSQVQTAQTGNLQIAFLIKDETEDNVTQTDFYSKEETEETTLRPKLVIEYTVPGWAHIKPLGIAAANVSKVDNIAVASISEWSGVAV